MKKNFSKFILLSVLISFGLAFLPSFAFGVKGGGIGIAPAYPDPNIPFSGAWFIYEMELGESKEDVAAVSNYSDQPITIKISALDAMTTKDGVFTLITDESLNKDIGNWIALETSQIDLGPNEVKEVSFTITVPEDADVGEHMGGIVIQQAPKEREEGGGLSIVVRVGARIYLTVPGEIIKELKITDMSWLIKVTEKGKRIFFPLTIENTGNVHLDPEGTIVIKNIFGKEIDTIKWKLGTTFPHRPITVSPEWDRKAPIFGYFRALAVIPYGEGKTTSSEINFWIIPYILLSWIGLAVVIGIFALMFYKRFQKISRKRMASYLVEEDDTVTGISEKFGVGWSKIVKVNQLKEPYRLNKGQKILIPGIGQEECDKIAGKTKGKEK